MQEGKEPPSRPNYGRYLIIFFFSFFFSLFSFIHYPSYVPEFKLGEVAKKSIRAPRDIYIEGGELYLKKGEIVVREGERVKREHLEKITAIKSVVGKTQPFLQRFFLSLFLFFILFLLVYEFSRKNVKKFNLSQKDLLFSVLMTLFTFLIFVVLSSLLESITGESLNGLQYLIPVFILGMTMRIVLFSEAAIVFIIIFSLFSSLAFERIDLFVYLFSGNMFAAYFSGRYEKRSSLLKAGIFTFFCTSFVVSFLSLLLSEPPLSILKKAFFLFLNGITSSLITMGLLPIIERLFDYVTDIKLVELSDLEHPLLEELMLKAPGTYHHSIVVGSLAKAAAESIGAHPLLSRVAAYFHDIGKLKMPQYFIENRQDNSDVHKDLSPHMSALIIFSHVKHGVELAKIHKLGKKIEDIIAQHHGTSLLSYFYNKAQGFKDPQSENVDEKDFRYPGPKPQTKEAGIVMLADQVEASSRMLEDPTPKRIETYVSTIIENIFLDGQLDECELTLKDLYAIKRSFVNILTGIFHHRVEYPKKVLNGSPFKRRTKGLQNREREDKEDPGRFGRIFRV